MGDVGQTGVYEEQSLVPWVDQSLYSPHGKSSIVYNNEYR